MDRLMHTNPVHQCAAQEARNVKTREKEYNDTLISKYYTDQRNIDAAASSALKDDVRRREREAKERQAEHAVVESMYRVRPRCRPILGRALVLEAHRQVASARVRGHVELVHSCSFL